MGEIDAFFESLVEFVELGLSIRCELHSSHLDFVHHGPELLECGA